MPNVKFSCFIIVDVWMAVKGRKGWPNVNGRLQKG
ncbi:hypothetical protein L907_22210 [Agrobacterium sp. C13]|nr:hypothetical protein L903_23120 [Agrobacterium sp. JL28]KVK61214.1 hypothetical protein L906_22250 [Agrobacterium sp. TS45]KVK66344.1 hypothetical protein L907_22210 [Agrobacterium sp. C13]